MAAVLVFAFGQFDNGRGNCRGRLCLAVIESALPITLAGFGRSGDSAVFEGPARRIELESARSRLRNATSDGGRTVNVLKTLLFLAVVPGTVAGWVPYGLGRWRSGLPVFDFGSTRHVGWLLILPGVAVLLWSAWEFAIRGHGTPAPIDPPKKFVASGLYRYVRNPMYLGVLATVVGQFLFYGNANVLIYAAVLAVGFHAFVRRYEEPTLQGLFGAEYAGYCRAVPRWFPRVRPVNRP